MTPEQRYQQDAKFHTLVNWLLSQIIDCQYSPTELRDAVMLAAIRYELYHSQPSFKVQADAIQRVDSRLGKAEPTP